MNKQKGHEHVPLSWWHMVPDEDLEYLNWALEVAQMDTGEPSPLVYYVIQNEMARRGLATHKGVLWLAAWQLKQNQKNKPPCDHVGFDPKSKQKQNK